MPNAVPVGNEHIIQSESEEEDDDEQEEEHETEEVQSEQLTINNEDFIEEEEISYNFEEFSEKVDERQDSIAENWNIYSHPNAICFYRLANIEENFCELNITYKIIVTSEMRVQLFHGDNEASFKELSWALTNSKLHSWEQFEEILDYYRQEPDILHKKTPMKNLFKAFELLDHLMVDELQPDIESAKLLLNAIIDNAQQIGLTDEEETEENTMTIFKEEQTIESADDDSHQVIDDGTHFDEPMDGMEEIVVDVAQKTKEYSKALLKCPNCFIVCLSESGFNAHRKSCSIPLNISSIKQEPRRKKSIKDESYESQKGSRKFGTIKNPKLHPW